jgi:hypothetical protein
VTYYGGVQKREKLILTPFWPISAGFCIPKYAGNLTFGAITFFLWEFFDQPGLKSCGGRGRSIGEKLVRVTYYGGVETREKLILTPFWPISAGFCIPKYAGNLTFGAITFFFVGIFRPARAQKLRGPGENNRRKISQSDAIWRGRNTGKFGFQTFPAKHYHKGGGGRGGGAYPHGVFRP